MKDLKLTLRSMNAATVAEAMKNLRLSLEHRWDKHISDDETAAVLSEAALGGEAEFLRDQLLAPEKNPENAERWGKALLAWLATDEELKPEVEEAIEDAQNAGLMDPIVLPSLLILSTLVVLLKWRPKRMSIKPGKEVVVDWVENDVRVVSDLAKAAAAVTKAG